MKLVICKFGSAMALVCKQMKLDPLNLLAPFLPSSASINQITKGTHQLTLEILQIYHLFLCKNLPPSSSLLKSIQQNFLGTLNLEWKVKFGKIERSRVVDSLKSFPLQQKLQSLVFFLKSAIKCASSTN